MFKNPKLLTIFLITFTGILGFSLILPLIPFYGDAYGASDALIGWLIASYAIAQLVGAPVLGRLSDRYGRRPTLIVSVAGTVISLIVFGSADLIGTALVENGLIEGASASTVVLVILFISRITDGLTGGNISVAQAYITDVTDPKGRSRGLALIGVAFGLGFIFGPAAGGFLSQFGLAAPAFVAAGISTISLILVITTLTESLTEEDRAESLAEVERGGFMNAARLREALSRPLIGPLLWTTFFFNMAFVMLQTIFTLYALRRFGLTELEAGGILTYVGVVSVIVQGGLVGPITERVNEFLLIVVCTALMAVSLLGWGLATSVWMLLLVLFPIAAAGGIMNVVLRSSLTKVTERREVGGVLGIQASVESLTRAVSPVLGGLLIERFGTGAPGIFGAALLLMLLPFVYGAFSNRITPMTTTGTEGSAQK